MTESNLDANGDDGSEPEVFSASKASARRSVAGFVAIGLLSLGAGVLVANLVASGPSVSSAASPLTIDQGADKPTIARLEAAGATPKLHTTPSTGTSTTPQLNSSPSVTPTVITRTPTPTPTQTQTPKITTTSPL